MRHVFLNIVVAIALCGCATAVRIPGEGLVSRPLGYGEIARLLEKEAHVSDVRDVNFQRDSTGSKLFISFSFWLNRERTYRTAIITSEGITIVEGFPIVWYDNQAKPLLRLKGSTARYDDEGRLFWQNENAHYVFKDGPTVPYSAISGIKNVTGGDCILIKFTGESTWFISKLTNPRQPILELPADLDHPECACVADGELVILGRSKLPHGQYGVDCLVYRESQLGYRLSGEIPLPWASRVYDLDAKTGNALIEGTAQKFAGYYRFNIRTKRRTWLGFAPADYVLFLQNGVIRTLDTAMRESK